MEREREREVVVVLLVMEVVVNLVVAVFTLSRLLKSSLGECLSWLLSLDWRGEKGSEEREEEREERSNFFILQSTGQLSQQSQTQ